MARATRVYTYFSSTIEIGLLFFNNAIAEQNNIEFAQAPGAPVETLEATGFVRNSWKVLRDPLSPENMLFNLVEILVLPVIGLQ